MLKRKAKLLALILSAGLLAGLSSNKAVAENYNSEADFIQSIIASQDNNNSDYINFIVKLRTKADISGVDEEEVAARLADTANNSQRGIIELLEEEKAAGNVKDYTSFFIVNSISVTAKKSVAAKLLQRSDVEKIVEDKEFKAELPKEKVENDIISYALDAQGNQAHIPWNLKAISVDKAREEVSGNGVVVGIIDSGVDYTHPAISEAWRGNEEALSVYSWYDTTDTNLGRNKKPTDATGHGTHVAGTILGRAQSTKGMLGIAPDAKWIAAKVFDEEGETTLTRLLAAGQWMLAPTDENGAAHPEMRPKIINNSWGGNSDNEFYRDMLKAWRNAGILPVFSAGNTGASNQGGEGSIGTPGSYPESFTVAALRRDNKIAAFSLRGPSKYKGDIKPDISAPGVNILSSIPGGKYELRSGTSMAGPHISGVAALVWEANPDLSPEEVENIITKTATALTDNEYVKSPNFAYGYGKVNAYNAVKMAKNNSENDKGFGTVSGKLLSYGEDGKAPGIAHTKVGTMYNVYDFELEAEVKDDNGIEAVKLYLAAKGSDDYIAKEMELIKGNKLEGKYGCTIFASELNAQGIKYYIEATDVTGKKLQTEAYEAEVKGGIGIGYKQDFENNVDGIVFGGKTPMWEWGEPKSGPKSAVSGSKVIATRLDGSYKGLKDSLMVLPAIDLSDETRNAALSFKHWYNLGNGEGAFFDTAEVWIGEIKPGSSSVNDVEYKNVRIYKNSSRKWENEYIDLSAYKGKKILVMFGVRYAGWSKQEEDGWYIDDIELTEASGEIPAAPNKYVSLRYKNNGQMVYSFQPVKDEKITAYALYRSKEENGTYEKVMTVQKGSPDFGKYSVNLSDYPLPQAGTYYYYAKALIGDNESEASDKLHYTFTTGKEVIKFDFENDDSWSSEEKDGAKWTRGVINALEQLPDDKIGSMPVANNSKGKNKNSDTVWGTELNDFRKSNKEYTLVSPNMDLSAYSKLSIYLQMWYNTSGRKGSDEWGSYDDDIGEIFISKDGGASWESFFKLNEASIDKSNRIKSAWYLDNLDDKEIPAEYMTDKFRVKFVLTTGSDLTGPSCGGWYIDDFAIYDKSDETNITPGAKSEEAEYADEINEAAEAELRSEDEVFELNNMSLYSDNSSTGAFIPLKGNISIKESGISVNSELGSGKYSLYHEAGEYTLVASAPGYKSKELSISLNAGAELNTDIILEKAAGSRISFEIHDKQDNLLDDAVVKVYKSNDYNIIKTLNGSKHEIDDFFAGDYRLVISAKGFKNTERHVKLKDEEEVDLGVIQLTKLKENENSAELAYDDGTAEHVPGNMADGRTLGLKFEAAVQSRINSISFMFVKAASNSADTAGKDFIYSIYSKNDEDAYPTEIISGPHRAKVSKEGEWTTIKLPEEVQVNGEFFVAYTQVGEGDGTPQLGVDSSTSGLGKSFKLINEAWNEASEDGIFMIRANLSEISEQPEAPKEPDEPQKPEKPDEPQKPQQPEEPQGPEKPQEPQQPEQPQEPQKPEEPKLSETKTYSDTPTFSADYGSFKAGSDGDFTAADTKEPRFSFVKKNGEKLKGIQKISVIENGKSVIKEYFFDENGIMQSGWKYDEKTAAWYYMSETKDSQFGSIQKGWIKAQDNNWYFLDYSSGQMALGSKRINGKLYHFNESVPGAQRGFVSGVNDWFLSSDKPYGALLED